MTFGAVFPRVLRPAFGLAGAVAAPPAANWYDGLTVAYQAKGAASYAASKINLANPGTYDAADGSAYPTWATNVGWTLDGSAQYLTTGIVPESEAYSMLVCFSDGQHPVASLYRVVCGTRHTGALDMLFELWQHGDMSVVQYTNGNYVSADSITSGVLAFAGKSAYRNGIPDGTIPAGALNAVGDIYIGATHTYMGALFHFAGNIQAFGVKDGVLTAEEIATYSAAMAAL